MGNSMITLHDVLLSDDSECEAITEPISEKEYAQLTEGNGFSFYNAYSGIRARTEKRLGLTVEYVSDWHATKGKGGEDATDRQTDKPKSVHTANYFRVEAGEFNKAYWVVNLYFKDRLYTRRRVKDEEAARAKAEMWRNWD